MLNATKVFPPSCPQLDLILTPGSDADDCSMDREPLQQLLSTCTIFRLHMQVQFQESYFTSTTLRYVAGLRGLTSLSLLTDWWNEGGSPLGHNYNGHLDLAAGFRQLKTLELRGGTSFCGDLIKSMEGLELEEVRLEMEKSGTEYGHDEIATWLAERTKPSSLRKFTGSFFIPPLDDPETEPELFDGDTLISSLFVFAKLEHVDIRQGNWGMEMSDAFVEEMARAWPSLQVLLIHNSPENLDFSKQSLGYPSLRSLQSLATYCPDLWNLSLSVDPSFSPAPPTSSQRVLVALQLTVTSPITHRSTAGWISGLFPNATTHFLNIDP